MAISKIINILILALKGLTTKKRTPKKIITEHKSVTALRNEQNAVWPYLRTPYSKIMYFFAFFKHVNAEGSKMSSIRNYVCNMLAAAVFLEMKKRKKCPFF